MTRSVTEATRQAPECGRTAAANCPGEGIESQPVPRRGFPPIDGPDVYTGSTPFPRSFKKAARAINAASGNRSLVVLANL